MDLAIESILQQRSRQLAATRLEKRSIGLSVALHVLLLSSLMIVPWLTVRDIQPIEFTPITIVPVQALGVERPVAPSSPAPAPVIAQPEPERAEPEPAEPEPLSEQPALPQPDTQPAEQPTPTRAGDVGPEGRPPAALGQRQGSALGDSLGTAAFGSLVGGLDNPDFTYGYYVDQMLAMISSQWRRPALGANVEAIIHFRIHRDGRISDVRIVQSSGYNSYDLAGLRAVQLAAPFPKLPQSYRHGSLGVNLKLR